jgi:hypothetical protein
MKMKFDRRRALEAKLVRESKSNPGYFKYEVLVGERDGTTNLVPSYGRDMREALDRILWKEKLESLDKTMSKTNPYIIAIIWMILTVIGPGITSVLLQNGIPLMVSIGVNIILWGIYQIWKDKVYIS